MVENEIGTIVAESAMAVHRELGSGLLETVYEAVLAHELRDRGLTVEHHPLCKRSRRVIPSLRLSASAGG